MLATMLLFACKSGSIIVPDDTSPATDDTAVDSEDTTPPEETEAPAEPDYSVWVGERRIRSRDCDEILTERGEQLDSSWEYYWFLEQECPSCTHFYELSVSPDEVCGIPVTTTTYRGLEMDADRGRAVVVQISNRGGYELDGDASFDGWRIEYAYELDQYNLEGWVEFPELEQ